MMKVFILAFSVFLLCGCANDQEEVFNQVEALLIENEMFRDAIDGIDHDVISFRDKYDSLNIQFDSLMILKDSLADLSRNNVVYDDSVVTRLESKLAKSQQMIESLRSQVQNNSGGSTELTSFLKAQVARAEQTIARMQIENDRLVAENDSIRQRLTFVQADLADAKQDIKSVNEAREKDQDEFDRRSEEQRRILAAKQAEAEELRRLNAGKVSKAVVYFERGLGELALMDTYIRETRSGKFRIKNRDIPELKRIALSASENFDEAKGLGHPDAQKYLDIINNSLKYKELHPLLIDR